MTVWSFGVNFHSSRRTMSTTEHPPSEPSPEPAAAIIGDQSSSVAAVGRSAEWTWVLHVYALIAIAIAGPMFARLQERTPFLISLMSVTVILFVTLWSVVIPGAVRMTVSVLRRRSPRAGAVAVQWLVGFTCCLILLETLGHRLSGGGWGVLTLAGAIAGGFFGARLYERWAPLRSMLTIAAFGSLLFPASLLTVYFRDSHRPAIKETLTAGNPVPVVMVVFDCFCGVSLMGENRLIDKHRYPHFAELATTSNWYRNCTSVHPRTNRAVPAILTGGLRRDVSAATVKEYPQNLFTLLNATGKYQLTAFEPFTSLWAILALGSPSPADLGPGGAVLGEPRSCFNSWRTPSSPWPWMNCIA